MMVRRCLLVVGLVGCLAGAAGAQNRTLRASRVKNPRVAYAPAARVKTFPFPAVHFEREGLARKTDVQEIMDGVVYPLVNKSEKPLAAVVVTFHPDEPFITVLALWHGTDFAGVVIRRDARGHFPADAHKVFFEDLGEP
jgi:hypothetical protein